MYQTLFSRLNKREIKQSDLFLSAYFVQDHDHELDIQNHMLLIIINIEERNSENNVFNEHNIDEFLDDDIYFTLKTKSH